MPATAQQFRTWAAATRKWAAETPDPDMAQRMRDLADQLENLTQAREMAVRQGSTTSLTGRH